VNVAALYQKIADDLRKMILDGRLAPGSKLPSEQELMQQHDVSRNTVRMAVAALVNQGLIVTQPGRGGGAFVRKRMLLTYDASWDGGPKSENTVEFENITRAQGAAPHEGFELSLQEAMAAVAERLHIPEGSIVVLRRLRRSADSEPVSLQDSYYPGDIAIGTKIMEPRSLPEGIVEELARLGYKEVGCCDELTAEMPSPGLVDLLDLGPGIPVLTHWRTTYSPQRPIRVTRTLFAADRNRLVYKAGDTSASDTGGPVGSGPDT
jgi:GntR family transcriptional regulator